jgi:hypothetical protein
VIGWCCPRCGARLLWLRYAIACPSKRCNYKTGREVRTPDRPTDF